MSGSVDVILEPDGKYAVGCFRTDCPEHSNFCPDGPWVDEAPTRAEAERIAKDHRAEIRQWKMAGRCDTCGQYLPKGNYEPVS